MTPNTDLAWANRAAKAILLIRILVGWVFSFQGDSEISIPRGAGSRTLFEDWHSLAVAHGPVRWRGGDHLRGRSS
jgi:hypothetical protein